MTTLKKALNNKIRREYEKSKVLRQLALDTKYDKSQQLREQEENTFKKYEFFRILNKTIEKKEEDK